MFKKQSLINFKENFLSHLWPTMYREIIVPGWQLTPRNRKQCSYFNVYQTMILEV